MTVDTRLFDETARNFAKGADSQIERNVYLRGERFLGALERHARPHCRVLDYGCGPGRLARYIASHGFVVRGVDPAPKMIEEARLQDVSGLDVAFDVTVGDGEQLPSAAFDCVVCSSVIEYVEDPLTLLGHFRRSLRPGGVLVISFANRYSLWRAYSRIRFGRKLRHFALQHNVWSLRETRSYLSRAGFEVLDRPTFFDSPFDARPRLAAWRDSVFVGTLGLVTARTAEPQ